MGVTCNYPARLIPCLPEPRGNTACNKHGAFLAVDESGVPCRPGSGVTRLSGGPCCVSLKVSTGRETPEGTCTDFTPCQLEPLHRRNCNCGGRGCLVEDRTHFVVLTLLIVLATFCTRAVRWAGEVELLCMGSYLASQFLKQPCGNTALTSSGGAWGERGLSLTLPLITKCCSTSAGDSLKHSSQPRRSAMRRS